MKAPIRVTIAGAAGQIGYATLFRIANGDVLGRPASHPAIARPAAGANCAA